MIVLPCDCLVLCRLVFVLSLVVLCCLVLCCLKTNKTRHVMARQAKNNSTHEKTRQRHTTHETTRQHNSIQTNTTQDCPKDITRQYNTAQHSTSQGKKNRTTKTKAGVCLPLYIPVMPSSFKIVLTASYTDKGKNNQDRKKKT